MGVDVGMLMLMGVDVGVLMLMGVDVDVDVDVTQGERRSPAGGELESLTAPERLCGVRASDIEKMARLAFPLTFLAFHTLYWVSLFHLTELHYPDLTPLTLHQ